MIAQCISAVDGCLGCESWNALELRRLAPGLAHLMEPIFSLPYPEFCVAQQLSRLLPARLGYSLYAPVSRQQPGVDLVVARRGGQRVRVACLQVKSSRTYSPQKPPVRTKRPTSRYYTWFNNFECPPQA